jgi:HSP20 family protein
MTSQPVQWAPFAELNDLRNRLDRAYAGWLDGEDRAWMPSIDIERSGNELTVRADLPGVEPDHLKIEVQDGMLTISGEQEEREDAQEKTYVRHERRYGSFMRSLALPDGIDPSQIKATTSNGVLEITIPLHEESKKEPVTITPTAG